MHEINNSSLLSKNNEMTATFYNKSSKIIVNNLLKEFEEFEESINNEKDELDTFLILDNTNETANCNDNHRNSAKFYTHTMQDNSQFNQFSDGFYQVINKHKNLMNTHDCPSGATPKKLTIKNEKIYDNIQAQSSLIQDKFKHNGSPHNQKSPTKMLKLLNDEFLKKPVIAKPWHLREKTTDYLLEAEDENPSKQQLEKHQGVFQMKIEQELDDFYKGLTTDSLLYKNESLHKKESDQSKQIQNISASYKYNEKIKTYLNSLESKILRQLDANKIKKASSRGQSPGIKQTPQAKLKSKTKMRTNSLVASTNFKKGDFYNGVQENSQKVLPIYPDKQDREKQQINTKDSPYEQYIGSDKFFNSINSNFIKSDINLESNFSENLLLDFNDYTSIEENTGIINSDLYKRLTRIETQKKVKREYDQATRTPERSPYVVKEALQPIAPPEFNKNEQYRDDDDTQTYTDDRIYQLEEYENLIDSPILYTNQQQTHMRNYSKFFYGNLNRDEAININDIYSQLQSQLIASPVRSGTVRMPCSNSPRSILKNKLPSGVNYTNSKTSINTGNKKKQVLV